MNTHVSSYTPTHAYQPPKATEDPRVRAQVDTVLGTDATAAQRDEAYRLVQADTDRLGGVGDSGINAEAIPARAVEILRENGIPTVADPQVMEAVDAQLADGATPGQRREAYETVQAYVDRLGGLGDSGITADALPSRIPELLEAEGLPLAERGYAQGESDAAELRALVEKSQTGGGLNDEEVARLAELEASLAANARDEDYAAGFYNTLGPQAAANLPSDLAYIAQNYDYNSDGDLDVDYTAFGNNLSVALGEASRSGQLPSGYANTLRELSAPMTEAIYLSAGTFDPQFVADLSDDVFRYHDPDLSPVDQAFDVPGESTPELGGNLFGFEQSIGDRTSFQVALDAVQRSGAESEVLGRDGIAQRLLDPGFETRFVDAQLTELLNAPLDDLQANPYDTDAMKAVESLLVATDGFNGRVAERAQAPLGELYIAFPGEIHNVGEGDSAFPAATESPLGRYLADSQRLEAGAGVDAITAGLSAQGTPPPGHDSWQSAIHAAAGQYRGEVQAHGAPEKNAANGSGYQDLNALASEIADIDADAVQAQYGANAIAAADQDSDNAGTQSAINIVSDYGGAVVGLTGPWATAGATGYNTHVEGPLLEAFWPTDNAQRVFSETVPEHMREMLATQSIQIIDSAARSGAISLPAHLRDPETGGLRYPEPGADAEQFADDLAAYIAETPQVAEALDLARANLEERINALETGQSRGDG